MQETERLAVSVTKMVLYRFCVYEFTLGQVIASRVGRRNRGASADT